MSSRGKVVKERGTHAHEHPDEITTLLDELSRVNNELVNLQRELAKRNVELERLNDRKNELLGVAAHDLRNPLAIIWSYSDFLLRARSDHLPGKDHEFLTIIQSSSEFMLHMVDDLLDVTAIESGKLRLSLQPTDLGALATRNVALNRVLAEKKSIELCLQADPDLPLLLLDPGKIEQVLNNLISNAVKFSYPGSLVWIRVISEGDRVLVSVQDEGRGIRSDEMDSLFEWFGKTSARGTAGEGSTGLGLAIAQKIVLGHAGAIWAESNEGTGSTFYVSLPIPADPADNR